MELSKRLQAVADLVTPGLKVADIGTDHGYIPIYLVENKKNPSAVAMDINRGPLEKAKENIALHHLEDYIETRLSDGVSELKPQEADSVVIAGMGGALVIKIMQEAGGLKTSVKEWVLQPQSELWKVRKYLLETGYRIVEEDMVLDEGKYYPMMKVREEQPECYNDMELYYGKLLLQKKSPVLKSFLQKEWKIKREILEKLEISDSESTNLRREELKQETERIKDALRIFEDGESI